MDKIKEYLENNPGLKEQMDFIIKNVGEENIHEYDNFDLDVLTEFCLDLATPKEDERKFVIDMGKQGYINLRKAFMEKAGIDETEIALEIKKMQDELPEGIYHWEG